MRVLLAFLFVVAALAERPSVSSTQTTQGKKLFKVQKQRDVRVTDIDRLLYSGVEGASEADMLEPVAIADVIDTLRFVLGDNWAEYTDLDDSEPISYLEFVRLSTSLNLYTLENNYAKRSGRYGGACVCHGTGAYRSTAARGPAPGPLDKGSYKGVRLLHPGEGGHGATGKDHNAGMPYSDITVAGDTDHYRDCYLCGFVGDDRICSRTDNCCSGTCIIVNNGKDDTTGACTMYLGDGEPNDNSGCENIDTCFEAVAHCSCKEIFQYMKGEIGSPALAQPCTCTDMMGRDLLDSLVDDEDCPALVGAGCQDHAYRPCPTCRETWHAADEVLGCGDCQYYSEVWFWRGGPEDTDLEGRNVFLSHHLHHRQH